MTEKDRGGRGGRGRVVSILFSVTRFGEILPLWHKIKGLLQFYEGLFSIWQNIINFGKFYIQLGNFSLFVNGQIMKAIWSH